MEKSETRFVHANQWRMQRQLDEIFPAGCNRHFSKTSKTVDSTSKQRISVRVKRKHNRM